MNSMSRSGTSWCLCKNFHSEFSLSLMYVCAQSLSWVQLFVTSWTVACQASLSMGFPRQEYWSGMPFLSPILSPGLAVKCIGIIPIFPEEGGTSE